MLPSFPAKMVADAIRHGDPGPRSRAIGLVRAAREAAAHAAIFDDDWQTHGYLGAWIVSVATA